MRWPRLTIAVALLVLVNHPKRFSESIADLSTVFTKQAWPLVALLLVGAILAAK